MNKTKILAFIALAAIFSACGSDEGSLPELANNNSGSISPYDTLVVKFKSDLVDIDKLDETKVIFPRGTLVKGKATGKELRFIGTNKTPGGLDYFEEGISDSIEFKDLKNSDGYIKDRTVFYFSTLRIFDKEPNDSQASASEIDRDKAKNGITFAGVLDHKVGTTDIGQSIYDVNDYYTLKLKASDTVSINVTNREALNIEIKGPSGTTDTTFQALKGKSNAFKYSVGTGYLFENPTLTVNDLVPFYINITDNATSSPPNPYTIRINVMEHITK